MRSLTAILALAVLTTTCAHAEGCPPWWFNSLPRDREWFYGVAKDKDVEKARDRAVVNLAKQAVGLIGSWDENQIAEIAGPGYEAKQVAREAGIILPRNLGLLAGWEQDDGARCAGETYILVRVEKDNVRKFLATNDRLKLRLKKTVGLPGMRSHESPLSIQPEPAPIENLIQDRALPEFHLFQPRDVPMSGAGKALTWGILFPGGGQFYAANENNHGNFRGYLTLGLTSMLVLQGIRENAPPNPNDPYKKPEKQLATELFALAGLVHLWGAYDGVKLMGGLGLSVVPTGRGVDVALSRKF